MKLEGNLPPQEWNEPIDMEKDPYAYNKEFDPDNPEDFAAWLKIRPSHISEAEWPIAVAELKLMLERIKDRGETKHERDMSMLGWKSKYRLLPRE